jgi:hypothetical protein
VGVVGRIGDQEKDVLDSEHEMVLDGFDEVAIGRSCQRYFVKEK